MSKEIQLTRGQVAIVDDEDYEWLNQWKWYVSENGKGNLYVERTLLNRRKIRMHRFILGNTHGEDYVDHINGNGLDNRRSNLRHCSRSENGMNRGMQKNNKTGYKGVSFNRDDGKFIAQIALNKRHISLGRFYTAEDAARAYDEAALKYHGEFAVTNFETD